MGKLTESKSRLAQYFLAAGATMAGAGLATSARGETVFLDLTTLDPSLRTTPTNNAIFFDLTATSPESAVSLTAVSGMEYQIVVNSAVTSKGTPISNARLGNLGAGNSIALVTQGMAARYAYGATTEASPIGGYSSNATLNSTVGAKAPKGQFPKGSTGYAGLRFTFNGETHYGFVQLTANANETFTLDTVGYNTTPNEAATMVPEPGTLALLATGAAGLLAWRRRRK